MFTNEYECRDCHEKYKKEVKWGFMSSNSEERCPNCGSNNVQQLNVPDKEGGIFRGVATIGGGC